MTQSRSNGRWLAVPAIGGSLAALLILSSCGREAASPVAPEVAVLTHSVQSDREKGKDKKFTLSVEISGRGDGKVKSTPKGVDCDHDCREDFVPGTVVVLTATAEAGSAFAGWTGACTGTSTCSVTMDADKRVTATFSRLPKFDLTVTLAGNGTGIVTSSPRGITCGGTARRGGDDDHGDRGRDNDHGDRGRGDDHGENCRESFYQGTAVTLTANPTGGSAFTGWSGACIGTSLTCTFTLSADANVTATFSKSVPLTVVIAGTGTGTVTSAPSGIACSTASCSAPFTANSTVVLSAGQGAGSVFTGWSGAGCSGTGTCSVAMTAAQSVTATFQKLVTLTVIVGANGRVKSDSGGIDCTATTCIYTFAEGSVVKLTAATAPNKPRQVITWPSCPAVTDTTCTVTIPHLDVSVSAHFVTVLFPVNLTWAGTGAGSVLVTNTGPGSSFTCSSGVCTGNHEDRSITTLTATPADTSSSFAGFSGASCAALSTTCVLPMDDVKNVTATFQSSLLSVNVSGNGLVRFVDPSRPDCNAGECVKSFPSLGANAEVKLEAVWTTGTFSGWSGGTCSGTDPVCTLTVNDAKSVTATFASGGGGAYPVLSVGIGGTGEVSVSQVDALPTSCTSAYLIGEGVDYCTYDFPPTTLVQLKAIPATGYHFTEWSGACSSSTTVDCEVNMGATDKTVTATFVADPPSPPSTVAGSGAAGDSGTPLLLGFRRGTVAIVQPRTLSALIEQ